jgi:hypothetical protein
MLDGLMDCFSSVQGPVMSSYEHGNETRGSIKGKESLDQLSDC